MNTDKKRSMRNFKIVTLFITLTIGGLFVTALAMSLETSDARISFPMLELPRDFSYSGIVEGIREGNLIAMLIWILMDTNEAQFWASAGAFIGLFIGGLIAYLLDIKNSKYAGFNICYGTKLWPKVFVTQMLVALVSNIAYIRLVPIVGWWPTFVAIVSVPVAVVFKTNGNWKYVIPSIIIGGLYAPALARAIWMIQAAITPQVAVVPVVGNVAAMAIISFIMLEILYRLPGSPTAEISLEVKEEANVEANNSSSERFDVTWFIRRVLADFTEAQFWGNEWASIGFILGGIITHLIIPEHQYYGVPWWPYTVIMQFLTIAVGILLYKHQWAKLGWYPTFVPAVSTVQGVMLFYYFGGYPDWVIMQAGFLAAIFGAILGGPIAQFIIDRLPKHQQPVVGCTASMAITTYLTTLVTSFLLLYPWGIA